MASDGVAVTAVIPAFNAAHIVGDAIASLQAQTRPLAEIIVVDDGSRDDTAARALELGARVIRQLNGGPAAARNAGIRAADTEWIALLDADDVALPRRIEFQSPLTADARVAVVLARARVDRWAPDMTRSAINFEMLWKRNRIPTSTVLLQRKAWEAVGGFDENRALIGVEDYNLWLRLAHAGWQFEPIDEMLVEYRPTAASLTAQTGSFGEAELANARAIAEQFGLPSAVLVAKEQSIYLTYGFELFHQRQLSEARHFLREAARRGPVGLGAQLRRLATYFPLPRGSRVQTQP